MIGRRGFLGRLAAAVPLLSLDLPLGRLFSGGWNGAPSLDHAVPVPTPSQLKWQRAELAMFCHFGVNTFTDREWGEGSEDPAIFNPAALDPRQWADAAKRGGFRTIILTAKHHDGFCLWPSATTRHSVASSPWRGGSGDVVREVADACRVAGLGFGVYLSPWDRNAPSYGDSPRYNALYQEQLTELLTRYGDIEEVWFDGANGEGPNGRRQQYDWPAVWATVRRLQPRAVIFSDAGPDVRWIGNEKGIAGDPCWSTVDPETVPYPGADGPEIIDMLQHGTPAGTVWRPGESDVSIRPGWFWHPAEDEQVRSADNLLELYRSSVGRNSKLLLNVPPTRAGLIHSGDAERLGQFGRRRERWVERDLAAGARLFDQAGDRGAAVRWLRDDPMWGWRPPGGRVEGWVELRWKDPQSFDTILLGEAIGGGQAVDSWTASVRTAAGWTEVARGTTIGHRRIEAVEPITATGLRLQCRGVGRPPVLSAIRLHRLD